LAFYARDEMTAYSHFIAHREKRVSLNEQNHEVLAKDYESIESHSEKGLLHVLLPVLYREHHPGL
jgi:hypothetical protein